MIRHHIEATLAEEGRGARCEVWQIAYLPRIGKTAGKGTDVADAVPAWGDRLWHEQGLVSTDPYGYPTIVIPLLPGATQDDALDAVVTAWPHVKSLIRPGVSSIDRPWRYERYVEIWNDWCDQPWRSVEHFLQCRVDRLIQEEAVGANEDPLPGERRDFVSARRWFHEADIVSPPGVSIPPSQSAQS